MTRKTKTLDAICLGRILVDLYGEQLGSRLEDVTSFAKYVGGSSGNMCIGMARQGLRSAMLSRVGDEHMGRFVREQLEKEGVDVSHLRTDPDRLTALVLLGIRDQDTFPLLFYRENCADMAIDESDIDEDFIASAKALVITGTHLSTERTNRACRTAIEYAKNNDTRVVLDIDYRPVLWGLTGHGLGEERYIACHTVSEHIQSVLPFFDLIVGTEEEFLIAGGGMDIMQSLHTVRKLTAATLIVKRGEFGVSIFPDAITGHLDDGLVVPVSTVNVLNVLGAGDAFMSGFMRGWINDEPLQRCAQYANGCGALVVSRHGCSPAIPSREELDSFLARSDTLDRPDLDKEIQRLHRVAARTKHWNDVQILAFDHRVQLEDMADETGADRTAIKSLKKLILQAARRTAQDLQVREPGVIVDNIYGAGVLSSVSGNNWFVGRPIELPKSRPLEFSCGDDISRELRKWPEEQVVKCLVYYDADDEQTLRQMQERRILELYDACVENGRELLLEIIPPADSSSERLVKALLRLYELGVYPDWWKLPQQEPAGWTNVCKVIAQNDPHCRGVVILGLDAPLEDLANSFNAAADQSLVKGFAVGRSIFSKPARAWLSGSINDDTLIESVSQNFAQVIDLWQQREAPPAGEKQVSGAGR